MSLFVRRLVSFSLKRGDLFRRSFSGVPLHIIRASPYALSRVGPSNSFYSQVRLPIVAAPFQSHNSLSLPSCSYSTAPADDVVFEVSAVNIRPNVINSKKPVVLYCTANWCNPCKQFGPRLEKDIRMFNGAVRLGKLDVDKEQYLASELKIKSVPTVISFFEGRPISSFVGVPDEKKYKDFLDALADVVGDKDSEANLAAAESLLQEGKLQEASKLFGDVFELHDRENDINGAIALSGLIQCLLKQGNGQVAKDLMSNLKSRFKSCLDHASVKSAVSALDLFEQFGGDSEAKPEDLEKIVAADPTRLEEKFSLASAYLARGKQQEAINLLLDIIKRDRHWKEDAARELLLKIFAALGPTHPLTVSNRQRLTSIWFA